MERHRTKDWACEYQQWRPIHTEGETYKDWVLQKNASGRDLSEAVYDCNRDRWQSHVAPGSDEKDRSENRGHIVVRRSGRVKEQLALCSLHQSRFRLTSSFRPP